MDVFYEESAIAHNSKKKETSFKIITGISWFFMALAILWTFFGLNVIDIKDVASWIFFGLILLSLLSTWFLLRQWKMRINISYDYVFVSGELRIAKVINVNKRKLVARFECDDIIQFGDVDNPSFDRFRNEPSTKTVVCTSNDVASEGKFFMYILAEYNGRKLFVLECREELLMNILKFARRNKLESDYVMQEKKQK